MTTDWTPPITSHPFEPLSDLEPRICGWPDDQDICGYSEEEHETWTSS